MKKNKRHKKKIKGQIIIVNTKASDARVFFYEIDNQGRLHKILSTKGKIGKNGIGKTMEGDKKTPEGVFKISFAFGNRKKPKTSLRYIRTDASYYWVDDSDSLYYNKLVSVNEVAADWKSAEHIVDMGKTYNYVLPIGYNIDCIPKLGSAIFMHCNPCRPTSGCVAISEKSMKQILQRISSECIIVIK